jgi:hypothetical protein
MAVVRAPLYKRQTLEKNAKIAMERPQFSRIISSQGDTQSAEHLAPRWLTACWSTQDQYTRSHPAIACTRHYAH